MSAHLPQPEFVEQEEVDGVKKLGHAACNLCRARKAKCSGSTPCTNCARRGEDCRYEEWKVRGRKPSHLKMETTSSMVLGRDRGIYALFHGEPLRNSEHAYLSKFFAQVHPCMPCVRRALVDSIIKERSERSMHRDDENTSRQAATHMLVYGLVGVGAQVSKEPQVAKQYIDVAVQGLPYVVESPTEIGVIALFVVTYYYFGVKAKSAVAAHTMTLSHLCYVLKRKRQRVDPLVNQTLMFFEKVVLVKLQKTRELYRLPSAEELGPLVVSAGDPAAVDTVNGRIGDICVMLVCMMVGTRWQARLDPEASAAVQTLFTQLDQHTQFCMAIAPSTVSVNTLALICALKAVFLYKTGQTQEALTWANNTVQMLQNLPKPVHCFLMVIVGSNVNEILVRNNGHSSSSALTAYLDELGNVWPLAKHYRDKRIEFYGSAAALFHLGEDGMTDILATTSRPVHLLPPGAPPPVTPVMNVGASLPPQSPGRSPRQLPGNTRAAPMVTDAASVLLDPEPAEPSTPMAAQALASVRFGAGSPPVAPREPTPTHCSVCGCAGFECGCEANRSKALYHLARESKKRALTVPDVLKPPSFSKLRATVTTASGQLPPASAAVKSTERTRKRNAGLRSPSEDVLEFEDDDLDELLFTFVPDALGSETTPVLPVVTTPTTSSSSGSSSGAPGSQMVAPPPMTAFQGGGFFPQLAQPQLSMIPVDGTSGSWMVMMPQAGQGGFVPQMIPVFQSAQPGGFQQNPAIPPVMSVPALSPSGVAFPGFLSQPPVQASGPTPSNVPFQHPMGGFTQSLPTGQAYSTPVPQIAPLPSTVTLAPISAIPVPLAVVPSASNESQPSPTA